MVVRIDSEAESVNSSLIFREHISKDTYIYLEELLKLTGFDLHPNATIDIEKPASVSTKHNLVWRLPLSMMLENNEWVTNTRYLKATETDGGIGLGDSEDQTRPT